MKLKQYGSEIEYGDASVLRWSKRAFFLSFIVTIMLLLLTSFIFLQWRQQEVRHAKEHAQTELQNLRRNLYLLLGNQQMFTSLIAQLMEEQIAVGHQPQLDLFEPYFTFLMTNHPSFLTATLAKEDLVIDQFPPSRVHSIGFSLKHLPQYDQTIMKLDSHGGVILDGPVYLEDGTVVLVSRASLYDSSEKYWGLLTLHFNLDEFLMEAGIEQLSHLYRYYFELGHLSGSERFQWGYDQIMEEDPLVLPIQFSLLSWNIFIAPQSQWHIDTLMRSLYGVLGVLVSLALGLSTYLRQINFQVLKVRSHTDSLTGLFNKREFLLRLAKSIEKQTPFALAIIDIDNFKEINDSYGHLNGDKALLSLVYRIKASVRMTDTVGRFGGDEFILLIPECMQVQKLKKIHEAINATTLELDERVVAIQMSMGIAFFPIDGMSSSELLEIADRRLYKAKLQGKGRVCAQD